ncbi:MAG: aspartate aminotransferase family protein [Chitinophagaceae bacterium]
MTSRELFLRHVAQTSPNPLAIEIIKAKGSEMWDNNGKRYIDLIGGISVCNLGHAHPSVIRSIQEQSEKYLHLMVYGEIIQAPQVQYASLLVNNLPASLNSVYFTNSGTEATEGAMKLAKRITGRTGILSFRQSYHGSTQGALSVMGDEYWKNAFRPLLPGIITADFNDPSALDFISDEIAMVIMETVQAERGVIMPEKSWIKAIRDKCSEHGVLLVLDEIQVGFGRTGTLWGFQQYDIVPDILLLGKAIGGGMPLGAFISDKKWMDQLTGNPILGHITTFGGHPVCCAAGMAAFNCLLDESLWKQVETKALRFKNALHHPRIKAVRSSGLLMALEFSDFAENKKIIDRCISKGVFTDWFLFASNCMRIAPPLNISDTLIDESCQVIMEVLDESSND